MRLSEDTQVHGRRPPGAEGMPGLPEPVSALPTPALMSTLVDTVRTLTRAYDVDQALRDLCRDAADVLGIRGTGISLLRGPRLVAICCHDDALAPLERVQERHQVGPCVDAVHTAAPVVVPRASARAADWPAWAGEAFRLGIGSAVAIPLNSDGVLIGVLDLYADARAWSPEDVATAAVLGDLATCLVLNASRAQRQARTIDQLQTALDSRIVIEQAKGFIAARKAIPVADAFAVLRRFANDRRVSIHDAAEAVVRFGFDV